MQPSLRRTLLRAYLLMVAIFSLMHPMNGTTLTVPGDHATIQGAIDAAATGDTIRVWGGTYPGPLNINKSLVVIGSYPDTATTIEAPADFATNGSYNYSLATFTTGRTIVHVGTSTPIIVVIQGFTIDGLRRGPAVSELCGYSGILAEECDFTLTGSMVQNVLPADSAGSTWEAGKQYVGRGVEVRGTGSVAVITGNTFQQINRFHVLINATDDFNSLPAVFPQATVSGNVFIGKGVYNGGQKGVWFNQGAYGTIAGNTLSQFDFPDPAIEPDRATGFALWRCDLNPTGVTVIENNTLSASSFINNKAIYAWGRKDTIRNNTVTGFRWGIELHNEVSPLVASNLITGGAVGVMLGDEAFGQSAIITIGGSFENKNTITGQLTPAQGGMAISLAFRDPLNHEELASPVAVTATYNDFGVYTSSEVASRIFDRADTTLSGIYKMDTVYFAPFIVPELTLSLKVFLQGPYSTSTGLMAQGLKTSGILAAHFSGATIPDDAVDSIGIEIRNATTAGGSTKRYTVQAWLLTDGSVRGFADPSKTYVSFPDVVSGDYYAVVRHRNHLAAMSSVLITCEGGSAPVPYDLTSAQASAYNSGGNGLKAVGAKFALFAGNGNGDAAVTATDRNAIWRAQNGSINGYYNGDFNLDGNANATDRNSFWRLNNGTLSQVP
jgi:hypothetical protein